MNWNGLIWLNRSIDGKQAIINWHNVSMMFRVQCDNWVTRVFFNDCHETGYDDYTQTLEEIAEQVPIAGSEL